MAAGGYSPAPLNAAAAADAQKLRDAVALHRSGHAAEAEQAYREILLRNPDQPDALQFLGILEAQSGRADRALHLLDRAVGLAPRNASAQFNRANLLRDIGRSEDALIGYDKALSLNPQNAAAATNRGAVLRMLGRYQEALSSYDRAVVIAPGHAGAHLNRGNVLVDLERCEEALDSYTAALRVDPRLAAAHDGCGNALMRLNRCEEAAAAYQRATAVTPSNATFIMHYGHALSRIGRFHDALAAFDRAVACDPTNAESFAGRASALMELRRFADAVDSYSRALVLNPARIETLYGRGSALQELGRYSEAIDDLRRLLSVRPDYPYALGMLVHAQKLACDWTDPASEAQLIADVREGKRAASPFAILAISGSPADLQQAARIVMRERHPVKTPALAPETYAHDRIRVGYLSADFHEHPVAHLISGVMEAHDRQKFEIVAVSYGASDNSAIRRRIEIGCDRFAEISAVSDYDAACAMRDMEIDIAVDLTGLTANSRPGILSYRPAPVQVNYLGYPGTLGTPAMDYILADPIVIPLEDERFYDEKIAWLTGAFLPPRDAMPRAGVSRSEAGLPQRGFVYACFNTSYKFNASVFAVWMRLLNRIPESVLWLGATNSTATANLLREAERRGISRSRLIFATRMETQEQHLARLAGADLVLDTLPFNAHSTAVDALTAGVPVLTCRGGSFAGRVAASLMLNAGLPEFVTADLEEYERLALSLAEAPEQLAAAKSRLSVGGSADTRQFARNLERAYQQMHLRARQGLRPQSFTV